MQQTFRHPSFNVPVAVAPTVHSFVEAAPEPNEEPTPATSFTDSEGEVYTASADFGVITLAGKTAEDDNYNVSFFQDDALKIIALIAEAAK